MAVRFHPSVFRCHRRDCNGYQAASENADINVEFRPADNRYLIVHECSDLDSQTTRDFISRRTDANPLTSRKITCDLVEKLDL
jgi:hypothetical protein